jgi:hypothetical protein
MDGQKAVWGNKKQGERSLAILEHISDGPIESCLRVSSLCLSLYASYTFLGSNSLLFMLIYVRSYAMNK